MTRKYELPPFLEGVLTQATYDRWLHRKACMHVVRDRKQHGPVTFRPDYKMAIHRAVCTSEGLDYYTGERLDWSLLSAYRNEGAKAGGRKYKLAFAMMPTVDHFAGGLGAGNLQICGWRTNSAKSDLSLDEFVELCAKVVTHAKRRGAEIL